MRAAFSFRSGVVQRRNGGTRERSVEPYRVLDLSRVLAGPWAAQTLADLVATGIKVEKPDGGDDTRSWGPRGRYAQAPLRRSSKGPQAAAPFKQRAAGRCARPTALSTQLIGFSGVAMAQQFAGSSASAFVIGEGLDTVDDDRMVALGPLYAAPFTAREIVRDFADPVGLDTEVSQVINDHVRRPSLAQHPAVAETCGMRRQR